MGSNYEMSAQAPQAAPGIQLHVLCLDRSLADQRLLTNFLTDNWHTDVSIVPCESGTEALALSHDGFDFVIFDIESIADLDSDSARAIDMIAIRFNPALLLACARAGSVTAAVSAMRAGAHDFLAKPLAGAKLVKRMRALQECMQSSQMKMRAEASSILAMDRPQIAHRGRDFEGFVGQSSQMQVIYDQISRIAPSNAPVFITGESGTGKEVCAQALHKLSGRSDGPMIAINCGAIPKDLIEAEMFGVARGAYTGAHEDRMGAAEQADGGTLFLDEIGELDLSLQAKLLRFLQTGTVTRIGEAVPRTLNVRIVCATNRAPVEMIQRGQFRQDLFYRLHVLPIHLPPLNTRREDILPVARHYLAECVASEGRGFTGFSDDCEQALQAHDWPGNVRELQNLIRRAVVMHDGETLTGNMLALRTVQPASPLEMASMHGVAAISDCRRGANPIVEGFINPEQGIEPMWMQEKRIIEEAMALYGGNAAKAAAALEISPSTIYRKKQFWTEKGAA